MALTWNRYESRREVSMRRTAAAATLGVHPDTLLNFERRGLIQPERDWAGHRRYSAEAIEALRRAIHGGVQQDREVQTA
jgi:DNA-binding transcriptional MerR regulator